VDVFAYYGPTIGSGGYKACAPARLRAAAKSWSRRSATRNGRRGAPAPRRIVADDAVAHQQTAYRVCSAAARFESSTFVSFTPSQWRQMMGSSPEVLIVTLLNLTSRIVVSGLPALVHGPPLLIVKSLKLRSESLCCSMPSSTPRIGAGASWPVPLEVPFQCFGNTKHGGPVSKICSIHGRIQRQNVNGVHEVSRTAGDQLV